MRRIYLFCIFLGTCSNLTSSEYSYSKTFFHDIKILIYDGYNHNLGFMLEFNFELTIKLGKYYLRFIYSCYFASKTYILVLLIENFAGFEIKIADYDSQTLNCIQILPLNTNRNHRKYKFLLRDPNKYEPIDKKKFIFYFGKISLNLLTRVDAHTGEYFLLSEILTPFDDYGVRSLNESVNIKDFQFGMFF